MPYIITTTQSLETDVHGATDTCTAVATLDEAREAVQATLAPFDAVARPAPDDDLDDYSRAYFSACADLECMESDGGTVGPLPDGTVIEVRYGCGYCTHCGYGGEASAECLHSPS